MHGDHKRRCGTVLILVCAVIFSGCAPSLKTQLGKASAQRYVRNVEPLQTPLTTKTIGIATFEDRRPIGERISGRGLFKDLLLAIGTAGIALIVYSTQGGDQPYGDVGSGYADVLASTIAKSNLFADSRRIIISSDDFKEPSDFGKAGTDFVLAGEVRRFGAVWSTGPVVGSTEYMVPGGTGRTTSYALIECYGSILLSLKLYDAGTAKVVWAGDVDTRDPCRQSLYLDISNTDTRQKNALALKALASSIQDVLKVLKESIIIN